MDFDHKMTKDEWISFNLQKKIDNAYELYRYYCHCGHSVQILPKSSRTRCSHCGHWVYKDKKKQDENIKKIKMEEFRNKLKKEVDKIENSIKGN